MATDTEEPRRGDRNSANQRASRSGARAVVGKRHLLLLIRERAATEQQTRSHTVHNDRPTRRSNCVTTSLLLHCIRRNERRRAALLLRVSTPLRPERDDDVRKARCRESRRRRAPDDRDPRDRGR